MDYLTIYYYIISFLIDLKNERTKISYKKWERFTPIQTEEERKTTYNYLYMMAMTAMKKNEKWNNLLTRYIIKFDFEFVFFVNI